MRPLSYSPNDALTGPRVGGAAPTELLSQFRDEVTQYFGTFPLPIDGTKEFSIFHRIDVFGDDPVRNAIDNNNQILCRPDLIWCVVDEASQRGHIVRNAFEPRGLVVGEETDDLIKSEGDGELQMAPYSNSKLGGACFVERIQISKVVRELESNNFNHMLQIGMHGRDLIDRFPWDPGYLNVWASEPLVETSYRFCIQQ